MDRPLRLLCVMAHPDDESMGAGGTLAKYAAEGVETYLIVASKGEHGWQGEEHEYPGPEMMGRIREAELLGAVGYLRLREVWFLNYMDGKVDQADPAEAAAKIAMYLRRIRPQVVVTFDPLGAYGHPDHIAISQYTLAGVVAAADAGFIDFKMRAPFRVSKLYFMTDTQHLVDTYRVLTGEELAMCVDGQKRTHTAWPDWAITARIDCQNFLQIVWQAIACHKSQLNGFPDLGNVTDPAIRAALGVQTFYRAYSLVNGGHKVEEDLFEGLR